MTFSEVPHPLVRRGERRIVALLPIGDAMAGISRRNRSLETRAKKDERRLEMTFVDADGKRQTVTLPAAVAADLVPVLDIPVRRR